MPRLTTLSLCLHALTIAAQLSAAEPSFSVPPELVLQHFSVAKHGNYLLVPVRFSGRDQLFLVDTAAACTVFDESLPLGRAVNKITVKTPHGRARRLKTYYAQEASVGLLPFGPIGPPFDQLPRTVAGMDLSPFREASGCPIEGILGMDFLKHHIVHVDFDRGELLFLKAVPADAGAVFPLGRHLEEIPVIECGLPDGKVVQFQIDTGFFGCAMVSTPVLQHLIDERIVSYEYNASGESIDLFGNSRVECYRGSRMRLKTFIIDKPEFIESPESNLLGLGLLSRFVLTFDFPARKIYIRKGNYKRADPNAKDRSHPLQFFYTLDPTLLHMISR